MLADILKKVVTTWSGNGLDTTFTGGLHFGAPRNPSPPYVITDVLSSVVTGRASSGDTASEYNASEIRMRAFGRGGLEDLTDKTDVLRGVFDNVTLTLDDGQSLYFRFVSETPIQHPDPKYHSTWAVELVYETTWRRDESNYL